MFKEGSEVLRSKGTKVFRNRREKRKEAIRKRQDF
jgi:hypothetical protein